MRSVLISGAGVAGPALAYWLRHYGLHATVVERASTARAGGYPVDLRGTAVEVVKRMGIHRELQAAHIATRRISAVDGAGRTVTALDPQGLTELAASGDLELPRGDLVSALRRLTEDGVDYLFDDSIAALSPQEGTVTFQSGLTGTYDLVVGADGLHSNTRRLAFGPEESYRHDLGFSFVGFTAPNVARLSHEAVLQNAPGRLAAVYAVGDQPWVHVLLATSDPHPPPRRSPDQIRAWAQEAFADLGGDTPRLLAALTVADDLYYDTVSQIRMPSWAVDRVALVGDAAYAPSFLTGQGTSLALIGAYVLAGELARADVSVALPAYERRLRAHVQRNQALIGRDGRILLPRTRGQLWLRNQALRLLPLLARWRAGRPAKAPSATSLLLPEYADR